MSLCLTKHHAMKTYLTSALDGGKWSDSRPGRFTPRKRTPGTHWTGGYVDAKPDMDTTVKRKFPALPGPELPVMQPVAQRYTTELPRCTLCLIKHHAM
jgi:hypothetical protein